VFGPLTIECLMARCRKLRAFSALRAKYLYRFNRFDHA
jgi:hypothetical protein